MPFQDLREFVGKLEEEKQVVRIAEEVDWNLEVGAITRLCDEAGLPAHSFRRSRVIPMRIAFLVSR